MNIVSGCNNNIYIWILIALVALGSNGNNFNGIFSGCALPVLLALFYCMWRNGTLNALFGDANTNSGCGCGCN